MTLEELEAAVHAGGVIASPDTKAIVLALIYRIRELEQTLTLATNELKQSAENDSLYEDYQNDPDWKRANVWAGLVDEGTVLP